MTSTARIKYFLRYYFKKLTGGLITPDDLFWKRFYRASTRFPGHVLEVRPEEILYQGDRHFPGLKVYIRKAPSSDVQVFDQVLGRKEYLPLVEQINKCCSQHEIQYIIDAGANVGYSSLFLKNYFPGGFVVCIEPDHGNIVQIKKNFLANKLEGTDVLEGGLWSKDCFLQLKDDRGEGEWNLYVVESEAPTDLKGFTVQSILEKSGYDLIDVLKIDIEGGEKEIFQDSVAISNILKKVRFLAIEIHDHLTVRKNIYSILEKANFSFFESKELTIATNKSLLS